MDEAQININCPSLPDLLRELAGHGLLQDWMVLLSSIVEGFLFQGKPRWRLAFAGSMIVVRSTEFQRSFISILLL